MATPPSAGALWKGAVLGMTTKSIIVAKVPEIGYVANWDPGSNTYVRDNNEGARGAITFDGPQGDRFGDRSRVIGVFYEHESERAPQTVEERIECLETVLRGCPQSLRQLAEKDACQFMIYEWLSGPVVTTAFWSNGNQLTAAEPWDDVLKNGADLVRTELIEDFDSAMGKWAVDYELPERESRMAEAIFRRKLQQPDEPIALTPDEVKRLRRLSTSAEAFELSKQSFASFGVII